MSNFVKLYGSILYSTVWLEPLPTKVVWITMLALADADGIVAASIPGLAQIAGVTRNECEEAIAKLLAPDPDSKTPDHEGRRIEKADTGWLILNHRKYRDLRTETQVRTAERVRRYREGQRREGVTVTDVTDVTPRNGVKRPVRADHIRSEEEAEKEKAIDRVLSHYGRLHPKRKVVGKKFRRIVRTALREFSADELIEALDGNAFDPWCRREVKHELGYVLKDTDFINGFREKAARLGTPSGSNGVHTQARAVVLYTALIKHGFTRNVPLEEHDRRIEELAALRKILDPEHFKLELRAVKPWTWLGSAREADKERSIIRIAQAIAPLQPGTA